MRRRGPPPPALLPARLVTLLACAFAAARAADRPMMPVWKTRMLLEDGAAVTPNATTFEADGQRLGVSVRRRAGAGEPGDVLALYSPASADPRSVLPVKWINLTQEAPGYAATGRADVALTLFNFRADFILRLVANGTFSPVVLAESPPVANAIARRPSQVHVALHADGESLVVQWVSGSPEPQQLLYSARPGGLARDPSPGAAASSARTFTAAMMCGEPAATFGFNTPPGFLHAAIIPGGAARAAGGRRAAVQYRVGSAPAGWSRDFSARAPPSSASVASGLERFEFLVFNDVGSEAAVLFDDHCPPYCPAGWSWADYTANSTKLPRWLEAERGASLALLVGDLSYANGVQADWDVFGHQFQEAFARWPLAVVPGNHERDQAGTGDALGDTSSSDSGGECNVPFTYRYYTPAWEAAEPCAHKGAVGVHSGARSGGGCPRSAGGPAAAEGAARPAPLQRRLLELGLPWLRRPAPAAPRAPPPGGGLPAYLNPDRSFYSFSAATVHFVMLDSESDSSPGSEQHAFAARDLQQVDRSRHPWLVVCMHRPMAVPTTDAENLANMARLLRDYEALFVRHRVDLVITGHEHAYARTCPLQDVAAGRCAAAGSGGAAAAGGRAGRSAVLEDPGAPVYVVAGHAGAGFTHFFSPRLPPWVEFARQDSNGYLRVAVGVDSLELTSVSADDGRPMDGVVLHKGRLGRRPWWRR